METLAPLGDCGIVFFFCGDSDFALRGDRGLLFVMPGETGPFATPVPLVLLGEATIFFKVVTDVPLGVSLALMRGELSSMV